MSFPQPFFFGHKLIEGQALDEALATPTWSLATSVAATPNGTNTSSVQLTETLNIISSVPVGGGVTLPPGLPGKILIIENTSANDLQVFAQNTGTINGIDSGIGFSQPAYSYMIYVAVGPNAWQIMHPVGYHGAFYDTTTQANLDNTKVQPVTFNSVTESSGFSVVGGSKITAKFAGTYNIQFSLQLNKNSGSSSDAEIWLRYNGVDVPWSNTRVTVSGSANSSKVVAAWNFVQQMAAGSNVELMWFSGDAGMQIFAATPGTTPDRPAIPSAILTVQGV